MRISTCGLPIAMTTATGRSSPGPTAAPRCATARIFQGPACRRARSASGRRAVSTDRRDRRRARLLAGVALAGFLILPARRAFLDGDALALAEFLAPAAVGIGHAIALGHALPVTDFVAPVARGLHLLRRSDGRQAAGR